MLLIWEVFYIGIIRSIFEGTWDSGSSGKAINYWWGFRSDAERLDYYETDVYKRQAPLRNRKAEQPYHDNGYVHQSGSQVHQSKKADTPDAE